MIVTLAIVAVVAAYVLVALHRAPKYVDWRDGRLTLSEPPPRPTLRFDLSPNIAAFMEGMKRAVDAFAEIGRRIGEIRLTRAQIDALKAPVSRPFDGKINTVYGIPVVEVPDPFAANRVAIRPVDDMTWPPQRYMTGIVPGSPPGPLLSVDDYRSIVKSDDTVWRDPDLPTLDSRLDAIRKLADESALDLSATYGRWPVVDIEPTAEQIDEEMKDSLWYIPEPMTVEAVDVDPATLSLLYGGRHFDGECVDCGCPRSWRTWGDCACGLCPNGCRADRTFREKLDALIDRLEAEGALDA